MSRTNFPIVLTSKEIDAVQNIGLIAILQYERVGKDIRDLKRAINKIAQSKHSREIELSDERLEILYD
jgi:deoxyribose-phosphate aldolase